MLLIQTLESSSCGKVQGALPEKWTRLQKGLEKADAYGIEALGLFGSYARGEQKPGSDIDVCIRLKQPTFFNMTGIQEDLEGIFSCKVDLVSLGEP